MSGGGTIVTDPHQLIFCTVLRKNHDVRKLIGSVCASVVTALGELDIEAEYKAINDIEVNGKKISGSGQVVRNNAVAIQTTLLLKCPELHVLQADKRGRAGLTSIFDILGFIPEINHISELVAASLSETLEEEMYADEFSAAEKYEIEKLVKTKYSLDSYTFSL